MSYFGCIPENIVVVIAVMCAQPFVMAVIVLSL